MEAPPPRPRVRRKVSFEEAAIVLDTVAFVCDVAALQTVQDVLTQLMSFSFDWDHIVPLASDGVRLELSAPYGHVAEVELPTHPELVQVQAAPSELTAPSGSVPERAVAQSAFNPRGPEQLFVDAGDEVTHIEALDAVWWRGQARGRVGKFQRWSVAPLGELLHAAKCVRLSEAQWELAWRYVDAVGGVAKDERLAAAWVLEAAQQGNLDGLSSLGTFYADGTGLPRLPRQAFALKLRAALAGHPVAQSHLAEYYLVGSGTPKDVQAALHWWHRAAERPYRTALYDLGRLYWNGDDVPCDYSRAYHFFARAAEQEHAPSLYALGRCFEQGRGVAKDPQRALECFTRAARSSVTAMVKLGLAYSMGSEWCAKDVSRGYEWLSLAAGRGDALAMFSLGVCHSQGLGCGRDNEAAFTWFSRAADKGHEEALCALGECYYNGHGVAADSAKALDCYRRAAEQGSSDAKYWLAFLHLYGRDVPRDVPLSLRLLRELAAEGMAAAMHELGTLYAAGDALPRDADEALVWHERAAALGDATSAATCRLMYSKLADCDTMLKLP